jgi:hemerythrin-like domain-containing protein
MVEHRFFHRMVTRQGVDLAGAWRLGFGDRIFAALGRCEACPHAQSCRAWFRLQSPPASYIAFCPNAKLIETCRILDSGAPSLETGGREAAAGREPTLAEVLAEPIVQLLMAADGTGGGSCAAAVGDGSTRSLMEDGMTQDLLGALRRDHRDMMALLAALDWQIGEFESGRQPDYELIDVTLEYFLSFADIRHHPEEVRIFEKLRERAPRLVEEVGDLAAAHEELAARARDFATALRAVLQDVEVSREALARWGRSFIELQRRHIEMEERSFFPAAAKALEAEDWSDLLRSASAEDRSRDRETDDRFARVRRKILAWQAQNEAAGVK